MTFVIPEDGQKLPPGEYEYEVLEYWPDSSDTKSIRISSGEYSGKIVHLYEE